MTSRSPQAEKHLWVALVHHPVLNREGRIVTTAITNLDVHDIARAARTFGLRGYFLVTPIETQRALAERIIDHWRHGHGATRVPERGDALSLARTASSLARAIAVIEHEGGVRPRIVATTARPARSTVTFDELAARIAHGESTLLVLGTGWGLADEVFDAVDDVLGPIEGVDGGYNHLSVRCAAAIMMDRLIGRGS